MSNKIKQIKWVNFKALDKFEGNFEGHTVLLTGKNGGGKSSALRGFIDRIRGDRPEMVVKMGEENGKGEMTLTDGCRFEWDFSITKGDKKGKDVVTFYTKDGFKASFTKEIANRYFPKTFDIDVFIKSQPKAQSKQLQDICGIDLTDVNTRYTNAYNNRTQFNKDFEAETTRLTAMGVVTKVDEVKLDVLQAQKEELRNKLNGLYLSNQSHNKSVRDGIAKKKKDIDEEVKVFNEKEADKLAAYDACNDAYSIIKKHGYDGKELELFINELANKLNKQKVAEDLYPPEPKTVDALPSENPNGEVFFITERPDDKEMVLIDQKILDASNTNLKATAYTNYLNQQIAVEKAETTAKDADLKVKQLEIERNELIATAKLPDGVAITPDGVTVNGFPMEDNQICTSDKIIVGLKMQAMTLGEVKTLFFDAAPCDRNNLNKVNDWAIANDYQLLIERPDFEGAELRYELLVESETPMTTQPSLL